jgi:hypothetical protein
MEERRPRGGASAARRDRGAVRDATGRGACGRRIGRAAALVALVAAGATGCATDEGYLGLAAPHRVELDVTHVDFDHLPIVRGVEGSDTAVTSVLFVPTFAGPRLDAAVEQAIARGHGDVLTRARVRTTKWWFLVGIETLTVEGNVVDLPDEP